MYQIRKKVKLNEKNHHEKLCEFIFHCNYFVYSLRVLGNVFYVVQEYKNTARNFYLEQIIQCFHLINIKIKILLNILFNFHNSLNIYNLIEAHKLPPGPEIMINVKQLNRKNS